MKKGFTLAEVLITLAIIGVVAALTIPTVVNNYQKKAQYTAFMKMYNTITTALKLAEAEHGTPNNWTGDTYVARTNNNLVPYFKVASVCEQSDIENCFSYDMKTIGGETVPNSIMFAGDSDVSTGIQFLQDGSALMMAISDDGEIDFMFDTNGTKGPNIAGRDIFWMLYKPDENGKWTFFFDESQDSNQDFRASECDPTNSSAAGWGCPARLLQEGKMDY